ncbi:MAG: FkbM family methyltransferase [Methanoregula sp.]|jgi:FkbM family methyltransferase|nr:FkbM family methyltransferase [Methanoregula sp.]
MIKKIIRKTIQKISKNRLVYRLAKRVTFDHRGENNADIDSNGELLFLKKNINIFSSFFDVGANIGEWTNFVLKLKPSAKIFSFEPADDSFNKINQNVKSENVQLVKMALGNKNEMVEFNIYGDYSTLNSVNSRIGVGLTVLKKQTVEMKKLDDFCLENNVNSIDFLKIDVEGNELKVLEGARGMLSNHKISVVQFEYGGTYIGSGALLKDVFDFFAGMPYTIYKMLPDMLLRVDYDQELENFQYANYIAIRNGALHEIKL